MKDGKIIKLLHLKFSKLFSIVIFLISAVIFSNCVTESEVTDYSSLESLIENTSVTYIQDNDIKGIAVGFIDAGNFRFEKGFGNVCHSSLFPIASVTKVITATAILQLVQNGYLDLDDRLSDYIPDFVLKNAYPGSAEISIRHLLTHSSGLSRDVMHLAQGYCPPAKSEILNYINNHKQISPAGYRHLYSNPGFEMLALVIEELSGMPYHFYVEEQILKPLLMDKSFFGDRYDNKNLTGFFTMSSICEYDEKPINYIAAGGLHSNVEELLNFAEMLLHKKNDPLKNLLEKTQLNMMFSRQNKDVLIDTDVNMGVSVFLEDLPSPFTGKLVYHGGGAVFTNTILMLVPDYEIGVVVLCNTAGTYQMIEQFARDIIYEALKIKTGNEVRFRQNQIPKEYSWSDKDRQNITGNYFTPYNIIRIESDGDSIIAIIDENRLPVSFFQDGYFSYYDGFYLKINKIGDEKILFHLSEGMETPIGKKVDETLMSIPENWLKASGTYFSVNPCPEGAVSFYESLRIYVKDNYLYLGMLPELIVRETYGITSEISLLLSPINDSVAVMQDFGRYGAEPVYLNDKDNTIIFCGMTFKISRHDVL